MQKLKKYSFSHFLYVFPNYTHSGFLVTFLGVLLIVSFQALSTDSLKISTRLNLLDQELSEKNVQLQNSTAEEKIKISEQVQALQKEKDQLQRRRNSVDEKLKNGSVLSPEVSQYSLKLEVLYDGPLG